MGSESGVSEEKMGQVRSELEVLDTKVRHIHNLCDSLSTGLGGVLREPTPTERCEEPEVEVLCSVAETVRSRRFSLESVIRKLQDLLDRLEV